VIRCNKEWQGFLGHFENNSMSKNESASGIITKNDLTTLFLPDFTVNKANKIKKVI